MSKRDFLIKKSLNSKLTNSELTQLISLSSPKRSFKGDEDDHEYNTMRKIHHEDSNED